MYLYIVVNNCIQYHLLIDIIVNIIHNRYITILYTTVYIVYYSINSIRAVTLSFRAGLYLIGVFTAAVDRILLNRYYCLLS